LELQKPKKYRGSLAKQIRITKAETKGLCSGVYELVELEDRLLAERRKDKLPELFNHYGLGNDDERAWEKLAWALALDHVPGFQLAARSGRKKNSNKPDALTNLEVYQRIETLLEDKLRRTGHHHKARAAADWLKAELKREKKNGRAVGSYAAATLAKMHSKGKQEHLAQLRVQSPYRWHPFFGGGLIPPRIGFYPGGRKLKT
jgi:hypothetical protein